MYIHAPNLQSSITSYGVPSSPVQLSFVLQRPSSVDDDVIVPLVAAVVSMWFSCYCEGKMFFWSNLSVWIILTWKFFSDLLKPEVGDQKDHDQMLQGSSNDPWHSSLLRVVEKINYLEGPKKADKSFQRVLHKRRLACFNFCKIKEKLINTATRVHRYAQTNEYHRYIWPAAAYITEPTRITPTFRRHLDE